MSEADSIFRNRTTRDDTAARPRGAPIVAPALTPEQWAQAAAAGYRHDAPALGPSTAPETLHFSVALSNALLPDGDPRKLTSADATALWLAASALAGTIHGATCAAVAAKLAAILPPNVGTDPDRPAGSQG
jgi:hypothetical protein